MDKWVVTGISGSGRIELLNELHAALTSRDITSRVYDVGELIRAECLSNKIDFVDSRILDLDHTQLRVLRASAMKTVELEILRATDVQIHLIGLHATFRWSGRLIPGIAFNDLFSLGVTGFVNVVDDVERIRATNAKNPKWIEAGSPDLEETQNWMIEEEFVTEVLADVLSVPVFIVARNHDIENLADLLGTNKKKIYLSYPITAVRKDDPGVLERIQGPILQELMEDFVVFNPLDIKDMRLTYQNASEALPEQVAELTEDAREIIKSRTVERDFQFIDQSDAVVVFYLTEKLSPGVMAEVFYAHRHQKPVYIVYGGSPSPFLEHAATRLFTRIDDMMPVLREFAGSNRGQRRRVP